MDNLFVCVIVRPRLLGFAAALVLVLGGCGGGRHATAARTATVGAGQGPTASFRGGSVPGTVYLGVGPDPVSLDAYRLRGPLSKAERLTYSPVGLGIIGLVANRRDVLIGRTCCDNLKFAELLNLERRGGLPGTVVSSFENIAVLAPDGRFAHDIRGYRGCRCDALLLRSSLFGPDRVVYREPRPDTIVAGAWSASNRLAILVGRTGAYGAITHGKIVLDPGTSMQRTIKPGGTINPVSGIWWGPRGELSYELQPSRVVIRSPSGQTRSFLLNETQATCWLPNDTIFTLNGIKHTFGTLNPISGAITTIGHGPSSMAVFALDCPH